MVGISFAWMTTDRVPVGWGFYFRVDVLGVSGQIDLTPVAFDITAALVPLRVPFADPNALLNDICQIDSIEEASALIYQGRGGLPSNASEPASPPPSHARLKRLLGER